MRHLKASIFILFYCFFNWPRSIQPKREPLDYTLLFFFFLSFRGMRGILDCNISLLPKKLDLKVIKSLNSYKYNTYIDYNIIEPHERADREYENFHWTIMNQLIREYFQLHGFMALSPTIKFSCKDYASFKGGCIINNNHKHKYFYTDVRWLFATFNLCNVHRDIEWGRLNSCFRRWAVG